VDPLDGTTNYAHGLPLFGVSIALEEARRLVLGVVYDPMRDELFVGERGGGATLNEAPIRVSATRSIDASLLVTGFPYNIRETADTNLPEYAAMSLRARAVRRLGSAVIDLAYVACGRFDGYWELRLGAWDVAAGAVLVDEAGGRITGVDGGALDVDAPTLLATNGLIHDAMLATLAEIRRR
jgi:myo-inositol-1(or 4)-monophosphatase